MSDPDIKGAKRPASRPSARGASPAPAAKSRKLGAKAARPKPLAKRSAAEKAPVRKADKAKASGSAPKSTRPAATKPKAAPPAKKASAPARKPAKTSAKTSAPANTSAKAPTKPPARPPAKQAHGKAVAKAQTPKPRAAKPAPQPAAPRRPQPTPRPQPTQDEAAALKAFERAHKEFTRGGFAEARTLFRALIEHHSGAAEVTARARTYLAIAEARLRSESALPRNAEELYDRGVIELNRGEYVAAQEMFERALRRDPEAAHIHYGLAATRARLGSVDLALQALDRAVQLQQTLRLRAQHDPDLVHLRSHPEYERIIFAGRP